MLIAYATWWLGEWQFGRLHDRKADNAIVRTNESLAPAPVSQVLAPGRKVDPDDEWRLVTATGTYDAADTVVVRYRTRDGQSGVDLLVPLVTTDGTSLLVDRGWLATENQGGSLPPDAPAPPSGTVEVVGYVRVDGTGESTRIDANSVRAVDSAVIGKAQGRSVYGGFVELKSENARPASALEPVELPELNNGPHFFYGLQWWFFGILAVFGFFYLLYDEWRHGPRGQRAGTGHEPVPGPFSRPGGPKPQDQRQKQKKVRQTNHPYARMRAEAEARAAAEREAAERAADDGEPAER